MTDSDRRESKQLDLKGKWFDCIFLVLFSMTKKFSAEKIKNRPYLRLLLLSYISHAVVVDSRLRRRLSIAHYRY